MDQETIEQIRAVALAEDRTVSNLINRIVKEWLTSRGVPRESRAEASRIMRGAAGVGEAGRGAH
jgi:hypothetical protein